MLCYRSERTITDITHDTLSWLVSQRRMWRLMMPLFIIVAVAGLVCLTADKRTYYFFATTDIRQLFGQYIISLFVPFWLVDFFSSYKETWSYFYILTFISGSLSSLFIIRYFLYMRSLAAITFKGLRDEFRQHAIRCLIVGGLTALPIYLIYIMLSLHWVNILGVFWFVVIYYFMLLLYFWLVPCVIMDIKPRMPDRIIVFLVAPAIITFFAVLVCNLPLTIFELLFSVLDMLASTLSLPDLGGDFGLIIATAMKALLSVSFCASTPVMITGAVMIHGAVYPQ